MVTFSLPGDSDVAGATNGTPKPRAPLPFAKRAFAASPFGGGSARRLGTPQSASARKLLTTRDEIPASSLNHSTIAAARNIFRASTITDSPPATVFSPNLPTSTMKKVFAPGATPEPSRMYRNSTAQATPRGMAAKVTTKELFPMRIASPPPELSGEFLTRNVPKEWNSKGSIYADQFLAHLCPPDLDDEQRRQFFCILDLRRLKYAANEIFSKKDWKLNVINFAKEFEKSRSIILLRYGLYEFQNVKPSKEVLKRWRREHGLPEPEGEEADLTPTKSISTKKRKAVDDHPTVTALPDPNVNDRKRRAMDKVEVEKAPASTPAAGKNKRKASVSDEPPTKMPKSTPSSAKSLFEKIANKSVTKTVEDAPNFKPSFIPTAKPTSNNLARSVFGNIKPSTGQPGSGGNNIFAYLSDASSAKNSGVEADAESSTDSEPDDSQDAGQSDEPSVTASGAADTSSQTGSALFGKKPTVEPGSTAEASGSSAGTRESTPGRSLFDRVNKTSDGQPVRVVDDSETTVKEASADQTWNPSTTPIKFAPSGPAAQLGAVFGASTTASAGSIFAPNSTSSNIFGAFKQGQTSEKPSVEPTSKETDKSGGESDKENDAKTTKSLFEPKAPTPATQTSLGPSLFQSKPAPTEAPKESEALKPAANLFGNVAKPNDQAETSTASSIFSSKPTITPAPVLQSSTLFGTKPSELNGSIQTETPKASSIFGTQEQPSKPTEPATASSLFGNKPNTTTSSLFGSGASTPAQSVFGASSSAAPKPDTAPTLSTPIFSFGGGSSKAGETSQASSNLLFGAPKSPPSGLTPANMFSGSPMKQDDPSPAKKPFAGSSTLSSSTPAFSFGNSQAPAPPTTTIFGASSNPQANNGGSAPANFGTGSTPASTGGFGFNFSGGNAGSSGTSFNNPFASGGSSNDNSSAPVSGSMFNFGGASSSTPTGGSSFQFGGVNSNASTATGGSLFGGTQPAQNSTPAFGGSTTPAAAPMFNFTAASPAPPQGNPSIFGSNQPAPAFGNLQPPAGGSSTTGTNSPFNLGGGSSLATTPAGGTPEPSAQTDGTNGGDNEEGEKQEQIDLTEGLEADEEVLHEVRAKVLKFVPPGNKSDGEDTPKSKSPWLTQGVGPLRLLKHKETGSARLLLRAEPRGHVALNRSLLPDVAYKADEKYVRMTTSNEKGDGLETWMIQVKSKDLAKTLAETLEKHKELNKK